MERQPLRRQLILIAVAGILPLALIAAAILYFIYESQRQSAQTRTLELTRALVTAVDGELNRQISALQVVAAAVEQDDLDLASFHTLARMTLPGQPQWRSLILADREGRPIAHTDYVGTAEVPPNPDLESALKVVQADAPQVGRLVKGRIGYAYAVRVPVHSHGQVRYVLSAIMTPEQMLEIIRRQKLPDDWVISIFDRDGVRVARSRAHERFVATRAGQTLRDLMAQGPEGMGTSTTLEGDVIFTAFARSSAFGWTVAMGFPESIVAMPALRTTSIYAGALALSLLAGLAAAFVIARGINRSMLRLREAAQVLGAGGEPVIAETALNEVHEVGEALRQAARERHAAEAEREDLLRREQAARGEAEAANRAKDQFLAMLGHELRNPIAAISNATGLLEMASTDPRVTQRSREIIKRQVSHLARLTDDLLDAARAVLGKIELRTEPVDLSSVVGHALSALAASGRDAHHRVQPDLGEAWVVGDPVRLEQVVMNLLVNAVKYTPEGGRIHVRTGRDGSRSFVSVSDDGVGMSAELAARAFDLFVQGRRDIDRSQGGLGIGLTLVRRIAELHGGAATLHSAGENLGSEFIVSIPAAERPAAVPAKLESVASRSRLVLLVEDNDDARETLKSLLELMGQRVETARDGVTGLEKALAIAPDIAIVDLGLPGLDGFEVARRLRANAAVRGLYLVALTGYGTEEARANAMAAGFDAHLTKPISMEMLQALLVDTDARVRSVTPDAA